MIHGELVLRDARINLVGPCSNSAFEVEEVSSIARSLERLDRLRAAYAALAVDHRLARWVYLIRTTYNLFEWNQL